MIGRTISHYKILEKLGEGGMGVVWKAEDTQLRRTVALKFLSSETVGNEEVKARLIREAQASASLDHPNICAVHGIHEELGQTFIAMAYIDGPSLADKIKERPLPLDEALGFAIQIAEGLQEAHEKRIVHRDIKPHNVMLTAKGQVKIMDFGLASLAGRSKLTKSGTTLGTPAYMAPEQLESGEVDRRADIWALGCVLYEMLTQKTPFDADYEQAIAYGILNEEPEPISAQRADVEPEFDRVIGKALAKDREQRYQHADDLLVDLRTLAEKQSGRSPGLSGRKMPPQMEPAASDVGVQNAAAASADGTPSNNLLPRRKLHLTSALAAGLAIVLAAISFTHFSEAPIERPVSKWSFTPEALSFFGRSVAVSPNGRHISYVAGPGDQRLWVRDLDVEEPRELAGTEGASQPFWSPDSRFIGFFVEGEVKKIAFRGGPPVTVCPLPGQPFGGSWSPDGESIAFSAVLNRGSRIFEVPAQGGQPKLLFDRMETAKGSYNGEPHFLPSEAGARSLLLRVGSGREADIVLKNLETGESLILAEGQRAVFSPSGHIVFEREGDLWALPFSIDALRPEGEAFPIVENASSPSIAKEGKLVLLRSPDRTLRQLVWRNRAGKKLGVIGQPQEGIDFLALSPDDRSVAVKSGESGNNDIWVHEVERPMKRRLTFDEANDNRPQWSPSGREITYQSGRAGNLDIYRRPAGGTGEAALLIGTEAIDRPYGWSRDENYLLYTADPAGSSDLWYLKRKVDGEGFESFELLATPFDERMPSLSPDGRFLAYCTNASGRDQVHVRPFPSGKTQWQVSTNGGCQPRWSRDGKELFYVEGDTLTAVEVTTSPDFAIVSTTLLFSNPRLSDRVGAVTYDVSTDGRFVMADSVEGAEATPPSIHVVENWYEEFRDRDQD